MTSFDEWEVVSCMYGFDPAWGFCGSESSMTHVTADGIYMADTGGSDVNMSIPWAKKDVWANISTNWGASVDELQARCQRRELRGLLKFTSTGWELLDAYPENLKLNGNMLALPGLGNPAPSLDSTPLAKSYTFSPYFHDHWVYSGHWWQNGSAFPAAKPILLPDGSHLFTHAYSGSDQGRPHPFHEGAWLTIGNPWGVYNWENYGLGNLQLQRWEPEFMAVHGVDAAPPGADHFWESGPDIHDICLLPDGDMMMVCAGVADYDDYDDYIFLLRGPGTLQTGDQWRVIARWPWTWGEYANAALGNLFYSDGRVYVVHRGDSNPDKSRVMSCDIDGVGGAVIDYDVPVSFGYRSNGVDSFGAWNYMTDMTEVDGYMFGFSFRGVFWEDEQSYWLPLQVRDRMKAWREIWPVIFKGTEDEWPISIRHVLGVHDGYLLAVGFRPYVYTSSWFPEDGVTPARVAALPGVKTRIRDYPDQSDLLWGRDMYTGYGLDTLEAYLLRVPWDTPDLSATAGPNQRYFRTRT